MGTTLVAREMDILPGKYSVDVWQPDDGLPDSTVTSVVQTKDGYLWLGTFLGLARFDGLRFTVFGLATPGLESDRIVHLFADAEGALWVASEYGQLSRYFAGKFTRLTAADGWPDYRVRSIAQAPDGSLLVTAGVEDFGPRLLLRYRDGRFFEVLSGVDSPLVERMQKMQPLGDTMVEAEKSGRVWVIQDRRLGYLEADHWREWRPPNGETTEAVVRIAASPRGGLWICSGGRVRRLVDGQWSADSPTFPWISHHAITEMMEDSQGQLWMGSWVEGVHWFRPDGTVERMTAETGFPGDTVSSVCEDREHNLWVGTYGGGLLRLKPRDFFSYGRSEGLPAHAVMSVAQTASGDLWAGLNTGGLVRLREGRFEGPMSMPFDWHRGTIRTLQARRDGTLWMGTSGPDILQWQEGGVSLQGRRNELGVGRVYGLFEDRKGALWIGGEKGLTVLDGPRMYSFTTLDGLSTNFVWAITQDRQGDLWIGTAGGGLNRLHAGTFHAFTTRDGLAIDSVRCLLADDDGTLWAGTWGGGLSRLRGGKFTTYSSASGLPGNTIGAILDDHLGHLWLNTDRGIFRVAQKEWDAVASGQKSRVEGTVYLRADGLPSVQCASGSPTGIRAQDGRLWFAMEKGLCVVDPRQIGFNSTPPLAVIEQIDVNGVRVFSNGLQVSSNAPPARDVPLRVPPGGRQVEIRYTGLSLSAPERVRFRYRLRGLEDQWEEADTRRVASYHSLGPGWYSFQLHVANNDGVWSPQAASFDFRVLPFWWQTTWFRSLAAMTLLGGVW
ncbi:MAG TPA: two-component regulator propeller domain-containing protein, partial [Candidatus Limnocylindria bacterium]|nr:two-component regulator propeller domain-containing protein [Candidatus Limnocylindria bacterium]